MLGIGAFAATFVVWGLLAARAARFSVPAPLVFVVAGGLVAAVGWAHPLERDRPEPLLLYIAEIALALVMFTEASHLGLARLRRDMSLPLRLAGPGKVVAVALGTVLAAWLLVGIDWWECAALAVILATSDPALCRAVVAGRGVPRRIRHALEVESSLDEGWAVPLLLLFVAGATTEEGLAPASLWATTVLEKIGAGLLAGAAVGAVAGVLVRRARRSGASTARSEGLALAGLAVAVFVFAEKLGASGLVAAFAAGLALGALPADEREPLDFAEREGDVMAAFVFFALGLVGMGLLDEVTWRECVYVVLSLVLVRPVSVALSLRGTGLLRPSVALLGWFGPRGLTSVVLALVVLAGDPRLPGLDVIALTTFLAVLLSIVAHGLSSGPLARRYATWAEGLPQGAPERGEPAPDPPPGEPAAQAGASAEAG